MLRLLPSSSVVRLLLLVAISAAAIILYLSIGRAPDSAKVTSPPVKQPVPGQHQDSRPVAENRGQPPTDPGAPLAPLAGGQPAPLAGTLGASAERSAPHEKPTVFGEGATAKLTIDGREQTFRPNEIGTFGPVRISANQRVPVRMSYPAAMAGKPAAVVVRDGGSLDQNRGSEVMEIAQDGSLDFGFTAATAPGRYHVEVRTGTESKVLLFWIGEELQLAGEP